MIRVAMFVAAAAVAETAQAQPERRSVLVTQGAVTIETYVQGDGPAIVMLRSTGRDGGEDFDAVAARRQAAG